MTFKKVNQALVINYSDYTTIEKLAMTNGFHYSEAMYFIFSVGAVISSLAGLGMFVFTRIAMV